MIAAAAWATFPLDRFEPAKDVPSGVPLPAKPCPAVVTLIGDFVGPTKALPVPGDWYVFPGKPNEALEGEDGVMLALKSARDCPLFCTGLRA